MEFSSWVPKSTSTSILLFESLGVLWVMSYPASNPNHMSYRKFYFYEFVANVLRDNIGIVISDLRGPGGCWRPKTPLGGQKSHEGVDLMKKMFNKSCSTTSKTP